MAASMNWLWVRETHACVCDEHLESPHLCAELEQPSGVTRSERLLKTLGRHRMERRQI